MNQHYEAISKEGKFHSEIFNRNVIYIWADKACTPSNFKRHVLRGEEH